MKKIVYLFILILVITSCNWEDNINKNIPNIIESEPDIINFVWDRNCYIKWIHEEDWKIYADIDYFITFNNKKDCNDMWLEFDWGSETCEINDSWKTYKLELSKNTKIIMWNTETSLTDFVKDFKENDYSETPFFITTTSKLEISLLELSNY